MSLRAFVRRVAPHGLLQSARCIPKLFNTALTSTDMELRQMQQQQRAQARCSAVPGGLTLGACPRGLRAGGSSIYTRPRSLMSTRRSPFGSRTGTGRPLQRGAPLEAFSDKMLKSSHGLYDPANDQDSCGAICRAVARVVTARDALYGRVRSHGRLLRRGSGKLALSAAAGGRRQKLAPAGGAAAACVRTLRPHERGRGNGLSFRARLPPLVALCSPGARFSQPPPNRLARLAAAGQRALTTPAVPRPCCAKPPACRNRNAMPSPPT